MPSILWNSGRAIAVQKHGKSHVLLVSHLPLDQDNAVGAPITGLDIGYGSAGYLRLMPIPASLAAKVKKLSLSEIVILGRE